MGICPVYPFSICEGCIHVAKAKPIQIFDGVGVGVDCLRSNRHHRITVRELFQQQFCIAFQVGECSFAVPIPPAAVLSCAVKR